LLTLSGAANASAPAILEESPPNIHAVEDRRPPSLNFGPPSQPAPSTGTTTTDLTQTYEGVVVDAACVSGQPSCSISRATTTFALRLKDGQTLRFDSVGNLRATKKKGRWVSKTLAGKEIRAKVNGMIAGGELIAVSIE